MNTPIPECPVCRVRMEEGHLLEQDNSGRWMRLRWTEGAPQKTLLSGHKIKGRRQIDSVTFRCPRCGWLLWFAPDPEA